MNTPKMLFVKPAANPNAGKGDSPVLLVRDPANGCALPAEGVSVPDNSHWRRRLKDGDVLEAKRPVKSDKKDS